MGSAGLAVAAVISAAAADATANSAANAATNASTCDYSIVRIVLCAELHAVLFERHPEAPSGNKSPGSSDRQSHDLISRIGLTGFTGRIDLIDLIDLTYLTGLTVDRTKSPIHLFLANILCIA